MSERPTQAEIQDSIRLAAEESHLDDPYWQMTWQTRMGAIQDFASKLRAPLLAEIAQLKEESVAIRLERGNKVALLLLDIADEQLKQQELESELSALRKELEEAKKLSVTSILLRVAAGDGNGEEIYAKSVTDVENELSKLGSELEDWQLGIKVHPELTVECDRLAAIVKEAGEQVCPQCHGEGCGEALSPFTQDEYVTATCRKCNGTGIIHPPIRKGWVMVPLEPDYQMCAAGLVACPVMGLSINAMPIIYKAMIAAVKKDTL